MRERRTPVPRLRATPLRRVVAAALALPLALGALAATALPATAGESPDRVSHAGRAFVGVPSTATFFCADTPERPLVLASWYTDEDQSGTVSNPTPGSGVLTFSRDVVYSAPAYVMIGLTCDYSPLADESDATYANALVNVGYQMKATTTSVRFHPDRVEPGNPINVSATITTADGPVTDGVVQFSIDGVDAGPPLTLDGAGVATTTIDNPGWGSHEVEAAYWGTDTLEASYADGTVWAKAKTTVTTVVPDTVRAPDTVLRASAVTVPGLSAPTGTVTFRYSEGAALGTAPLVDGEAVLPLPELAHGVYEGVFAVYSGDDTYGDASSGRRTLTVEPALVVAPVDPTVTVPTTVTTTIATQARITVGFSTAPRPTGTVTVSEGGTVLREVPVPETGDFTLVLPVLAPGTHDLVVRTAASAAVNATERPVRVTVSGEPAQESPTPDADLTGSTSTLTSGEKITLVARGFLPGETVAFYLHSDPVFLGTAVADADGVATLVVALPTGVPTGAHHVQATGGTSMRWAEITVTLTDGTAVVDPPVVGPVVTVPVAVVAAPAATRVAPPVTAVPAAAPTTATPLAATGAEIGSTALLMSVLVGSGALLLVGRRRVAAGSR